MKIISLSDAKANLSRYGNLCQAEPVIVTMNGRPSFQVLPLKEYDDLIDRLIESSRVSGNCAAPPSGETISLDEARRRFP
jgi:prevent-host-death family protein